MSPHYCQRCGDRLDDRNNCATCNSYEPIEELSNIEVKLDKLIEIAGDIKTVCILFWIQAVVILALIFIFGVS